MSTSPTASDMMMHTWFADLEGSDDDDGETMAEVTFESATHACIPFGTKHRGETIGGLVLKKSGRSYLRYLLEWDGLFTDLRANIECVMAAYNATAGAAAPKKRKRPN
jgi:hypothetical protein